MRWGRKASWLLVLSVASALGVAAAIHAWPNAWVGRCMAPQPLVLGLDAEQEALTRALVNLTTKESRILWEETSTSPEASRWTALLPHLTERSYMGGLGPDLCIEHAYARLVDQKLAGRPVGEWSDAELADFCRRYNIGWAVCRSPAAVARFRSWKEAQAETLPQLDDVSLFRLPAHSFVLKGKARVVQADSKAIVLADVVPDAGMLVLSFHYQSGVQVTPSRVRAEPEPDAEDPIPLIRLRVTEPVSRLTLSWDRP
jgi:hypothetical protein